MAFERGEGALGIRLGGERKSQQGRGTLGVFTEAYKSQEVQSA